MFVKYFFSLTLFFLPVFGDGEITFLQSPPSISFDGHQKLPLSLVKDVFSASLGFSVQEESDWRGMKVIDPFGYAAVVVGISVPGLSSLDFSEGHKFPLDTDSTLDNIWTSLEWKIAERYPLSDNDSVFHIPLDEGKIPAEIHLGNLDVEQIELSTLKFLNPEVAYDNQFIEQIALLNGISKKIEENSINHDAVPDVYWIDVSALHPLIDSYGADSKPVFEAKQLLDASLKRLSEAFKRAYNSKVLVAAIASDAPHTRRFRREAGAPNNDLQTTFNLASEYNSNYPVMFNIFFWFGIIYTFVLLAVALGMADMDPGRDSIIYRMTSNRMKKDN